MSGTILNTNLRRFLISLPIYLLTVPFVVLLRLISPWVLIRWSCLINSRIGHFAANTELYLCERDAGINVPSQYSIDIFYTRDSICNEQLLKMWKRVINIWPEIILIPIARINKLFPGWEIHEIGLEAHTRDIHNLYDSSKPHLKFRADEEKKGQLLLTSMGISKSDKFVCVIVRDSAYLPGNNWAYHNFRDCNIDNFILAAEELAERGYFVIRMGAKVIKPFISSNPKIIDYACNGTRNDFMDIYLGAKCHFCLSTGTGWDAVPEIFRRPVAYVNLVPLGYLLTFRKDVINLTKHHYFKKQDRQLSLSQIFQFDVGFCLAASQYEDKEILLIENSPEEIKDVVIEMEERLAGTWQGVQNDENLQDEFWKIFPCNAISEYTKGSVHGEIRSLFSTIFLRNNKSWLE